MNNEFLRIGFYGAGNMAEALARGAIRGNVTTPADTVFYDVKRDRVAALAGELGARAASHPADLFAGCDLVVLAVKPQNLYDVADACDGMLTEDHVMLSILAGTTTAALEDAFSHDDCSQPRVVRAMPNTPALVGAGAAALAPGAYATDEDVILSQRILDAVGETAVMAEDLLDAITGLTGSGPAYFFLMLEAMLDAAAKQGLDEDDARRLLLATMEGSAKLARDSDAALPELRKRVTSPGGTTAAGLRVLNEHGFKDAVVACVDAATERSKELGEG